MFQTPPEWKIDNSKSRVLHSEMNNNAHDSEKGRIVKKPDGPVITVPQLISHNTTKINKDFKGIIDEDFKTRSSQLSNAHFKEMPCLIKVAKTDIQTHYLPAVGATKNDLHLRPRKITPVHKKNEYGFDKTATKGFVVRKINPEEIANKVIPKTKLNDVKLDSNRVKTGSTPIVPVVQHKQKILVKH